LIPILSKLGKQRSSFEIDLLTELISDIGFFKEKHLDNENLRHIAKTLYYEQYDTGTIVFDYGSIGEKFYIILKGKVSV
jgi:signal-transduction protein with cAMP-binding, CBS, and nucleotidyltransferase domain